MSDYAEPKTKTIKVPGPDHPITIERNALRRNTQIMLYW
jgi:hypothetical protein